MTFWYYESDVFRYDPFLPATWFYFRGVDGGVGDSKDSFYEELEQVFDHFPRYYIKILLGDFKAKVGRENIFKPTIENESLHQDSKGNGVRIVKLRYIKKSSC